MQPPDLFRRYCEAKVVHDEVENRVADLRAEVHAWCMGELAKYLWTRQCSTTNPNKKAKTRKLQGNKRTPLSEMEATLIVEKNLKRTLNSPAKDAIAQVLIELGLTPDDAKNLVNDCLEFTPVHVMRPLGELLAGHYESEKWIDATNEEKEAGQAIISWLTAQPDTKGSVEVPSLSPQQVALVIIQEEQIKIKSGFFKRFPKYCRSVEQVQSVLRIVQPAHFLKDGELASKGTAEDRAIRLAKAAMELFGDSDE